MEFQIPILELSDGAGSTLIVPAAIDNFLVFTLGIHAWM